MSIFRRNLGLISVKLSQDYACSSAKDVSDDLKQVVVTNSNMGMSYRVIASITGLSLGAIAGIMKVRILRIFGGEGTYNFIFFFSIMISGRFLVSKSCVICLSFRNNVKLAQYHPAERTVGEN